MAVPSRSHSEGSGIRGRLDSTARNRPWQLRVHAGRDPKTNRKRYVEQTVHGTNRRAERALAQLVSETG